MTSSLPFPCPKALIFDLMGTCLDWHSSITPVLAMIFKSATISNPPHRRPSEQYISDFALQWRQGFFDEIHRRFEAGEPLEDTDVTHSRVLRRLLKEHGWLASFTDDDVRVCVQAWHRQKAWPDVVAALPRLRRDFDVCVLANGTTRLQVDITKSAGLGFDILLSSELLGVTKPDPAAYTKAMQQLKRRPQDCLMVAAHAYDLRAAKAV